jgi:hypothetical protein
MRVLSLAVLVALTAVAANAVFTQEEIFTWTTDMGITYESHDVTSFLPAGVGSNIYFEWNYNTNGYTYLWSWCIDNAYVYDDGGDLLPAETFDSWLPTDWYTDTHGEAGDWEQSSTTYYGLPDDPPYAAADSDSNPGDAYDASLFCPTVYTADTGVTVEFDSQYQNFAGYDVATFYLWWEEVVGIKSASLGEIKATFK